MASCAVVDVDWALAEELDTYAKRDSASLSDIKVSENMTSYCSNHQKDPQELWLVGLLVERRGGHHEH